QAVDRQAGQLIAALGDELELLLPVGLRDAALGHERGDAAGDVVEPEALDREPVADVVFGDDLAIDRGRGAEVTVVPAPRRVADEDEDGDADGEEEAGIDEAVPAVTGIPPGAAAASRDRSGSESHAGEVSCSSLGRAIHAGRVGGGESYRKVSARPGSGPAEAFQAQPRAGDLRRVGDAARVVDEVAAHRRCDLGSV